jgi:hypothetical protein
VGGDPRPTLRRVGGGDGIELPPPVPEAARPHRVTIRPSSCSVASGVTTVLWAGGFRPAFSWIDLRSSTSSGSRGCPRRQRGPGPRVRRLPWLHTRQVHHSSSGSARTRVTWRRRSHTPGDGA